MVLLSVPATGAVAVAVERQLLTFSWQHDDIVPHYLPSFYAFLNTAEKTNALSRHVVLHFETICVWYKEKWNCALMQCYTGCGMGISSCGKEALGKTLMN